MVAGKTLLFLLILIGMGVPFVVKGNDPMPWKDARAIASGNIYAPFKGYANPSALSLDPERSLQLTYENRFLVKELSTLTACLQQPNRWLDFSLLINYFGCDNFHEIRCGLNVSKMLKPNLSLGIRVYYFGLEYAGNEGLNGSVTGDVGMQYLPVDNFRIGFLIQNPFRVSYKHDGIEYDLPVCIETGAEYSITKECRVSVAVEKDTRYPVCFKGGFNYEIERFLELRAGLLSSPFMPTFGAGLHFDVFSVDIAFSYHSTLGISPAITISYNF